MKISHINGAVKGMQEFSGGGGGMFQNVSHEKHSGMKM